MILTDIIRLFQTDPQLKDGIPYDMRFQKRKNIPNRIVIHHSAGWDMKGQKKEAVIEELNKIGLQHYIDWTGSAITYHQTVEGLQSWCTYHYAVWQNCYGWSIVQLVKYPMSEICWHSGVEEINNESFGICILGNYIDHEVDINAFKIIRDLFRFYNFYLKNKGQELIITGHKDHFATGCPGKIYDQLDILRAML